MSFIGVGFEQAIAGGKYVFIEDTHGNEAETVTIDQCRMAGNPAGGGFVGIDLQRVRRTVLRSVSTSADQGAGNYALQMDANCRVLEADSGCRFLDFALNGGAALNIDPAVDREQIVFPDRKLTTPPALAGYNGNSFSTSSATLDMSTLITGNRYPTHGVPPRGYTLWVQARDSGSSGMVGRMVELAKSSSEPALRRAVVDLDGVSDDRRRQETMYVPANTDGSIWLNVLASGADTLDLWIYVLKIHN